MSAFQGQEGKVASEVHLVLGVVKQGSESEETGGASFQRGGSEQGHGAGRGGREACEVTAAPAQWGQLWISALEAALTASHKP